MSTCCPYRHTSYASWRYLTFKRFFASPSYLACSPPISLTASTNNNCPRQSSTSFRTRVESARQNGLDGEAHKHLQQHLELDDATKVADFGRDNGRQWQPDRFSLDDREEVSHVSEHASLQRREHERTEKRREGTTLMRERSKKSEAFKQRRKRQQWSPYYGQGREDLKSLAAPLQLALRPAESPIYNDKAPGQDKISSRLPVSPLVQAFEREKPTKSSPKGTEKEELAGNPWATMLASPMRLCSATGVRVPKDLLVSWGLVRNPATEEVYFMPTELAELDSLKDPRRRTKPSASVSTMGSTIPEGDPSNRRAHARPLSASADVGSDTENSEVELVTSHHQNNRVEADPGLDNRQITSQTFKPSPPSSPTIYMLPFLPLLYHLTNRFTSLQKDMVTRRSKPNAINSILPWRVKASVDRTKSYADQRGNSPSSFAPKGASNPPPLDNLQHVKWEPGINGVMLRILRERVLAALETLGNRNQKLWRKQSELVRAVRITKTVNAGREGENWRLLADDHHIEPVTDGDKAPDVSGVEICLLVEPNGANLPTPQHATGREGDQIHKKEDQLGEEETTQASSSAFPTESSTAIDGHWNDFSTFAPSDIEIGQSRRVPLFLLNDLLDNDSISRFRQLSTTIGVLAPRVSAARIGNEDTYVLIVPAEAFGGKSVVEEVWRLWRFLGGRPE